MKIPKTIKLHRKLKKELKQGFTQNIRNGLPEITGSSVSCYTTVSYSGSGTKAFRRLCKFARKEEKRCFQIRCDNVAGSVDEMIEKLKKQNGIVFYNEDAVFKNVVWDYHSSPIKINL